MNETQIVYELAELGCLSFGGFILLVVVATVPPELEYPDDFFNLMY